MKEEIIENFNRLAGAYEKTVDTQDLYNIEYERPAMLAEIAETLEGKTVLDAGCAAGWYTQKLSGRGARVTAIDVSPEMVEAARRRVGDQAEVFCMDLEKPLPFPDSSFDYIVSSLTLHYLKEWEPTFKEFQRILKPDGVFLFSVHHPFTDLKLSQNADYFAVELLKDQWEKEGQLYDVVFYRRSLSEIMAETLNHFAIEKIVEPKPTSSFKELDPAGYERLMRAPNFLIIKACSKLFV